MKNILGKIIPSKDDRRPWTELFYLTSTVTVMLNLISPDRHGGNVGIVAGSDAPIVIPLEGTLRRYLTEYFKIDKNMSEANAKEKAAAGDHWYCVVDGIHRLLAIC